MIYWGTINDLFLKMMIMVAIFSWLAIGYCIWFNAFRIIPFGWLTSEQTLTYFSKSILIYSSMMLLSYHIATRFN